MKKKNNLFKTLALLLILPLALTFVGCGPKKTESPADQAEEQQEEQVVDAKEVSYQQLKSVIEDMTDYSDDYVITESSQMSMSMTNDPIIEEEQEVEQTAVEDDNSEEQSESLPLFSNYIKTVTHVDMANGQMVQFNYGFNVETGEFNEEADDVSYIVKIGDGADAVWAYLCTETNWETEKKEKIAKKFSQDHVAHEYELSSQVKEMTSMLNGDTIAEVVENLENSGYFDSMIAEMAETLPVGANLKFDFDVQAEKEGNLNTLKIIISVSFDNTLVQTVGEEEQDDETQLSLPEMELNCNFEMSVKFTSDKVVGFYIDGQMEVTSVAENDGVKYQSTTKMNMNEKTEISYTEFDSELLPTESEIEEYGEVQERDRYIYIVIDGQRQGISDYSYEWSEELEDNVVIHSEELVFADVDWESYGINIDAISLDFYLDEECTIPAGDSIKYKSYNQTIYTISTIKEGYAVLKIQFVDENEEDDNGFTVIVIDINDTDNVVELPTKQDIEDMFDNRYIFGGYTDINGDVITSIADLNIENQGYYVIYGQLEESPDYQLND